MKIDLLLPRGKNPLSYYNSIMNLNTRSLALVGKTNKGIKTHLGRLGQKESHTISPKASRQPKEEVSELSNLLSSVQNKEHSARN
jgi:hypothetical protein